MNKKQFQKLKENTSSFCKINFYQISLETKEATGLLCSSFSFLRKDSVLEQMKEVLKELKYPYTVSEEGLTNTNQFYIRFNDI